MKELSIEQKAQRYNEALKRAMRLYEQGTITESLSYIFPELKESEDERIRKAIKKALQVRCDGSRIISDEPVILEEAIAWLEKQKTSEEALQYLRENHSSSEMSDFQAAMNIAVAKAYDKGYNDGLEKQGESTDINPSEFDLRLNKLLKQFETLSKEELASSLSFYLNVVQNNGSYKEEKQGEQKPTDKVEPKFHEGEWITNGDYTWKIVEVKPLDYIFQSQDGNIVDDTISHVDEQFHSFTIEDAKDGDVLADGNLPFIFKKIDTNKYSYAYCGITVDDGFKIESKGQLGEWTWMQDIKPATKEQCDTLEKAMADAGYTFDFDKKELKKIEQKPTDEEMKEALRTEYEKGRADAIAEMQKPAWSEEDEKIINKLIAVVELYYGIGDDLDKQRCLSWLKSLKDRVQPQPKQEWSEEDKDLMYNTISNLTELKDRYGEEYGRVGKCIDWIKSLRPQSTWKPSEEQMHMLRRMITALPIGEVHNGLESLYNELETLKRE